MNMERARHIREVWDQIESGEPNLSTESLAQRVANICKVGVDAVFDALYATKDERKPQ